jgi:hypothetical protein
MAVSLMVEWGSALVRSGFDGRDSFVSAFSFFKWSIFKILNICPPLGRKIWKAYYMLHPRDAADLHHSAAERQQLFEQIWLTNEWYSNESKSGRGSTLNYTKNLRKSLPDIIQKFDVKTLLDAPCGDFNWMQHVNFPKGTKYIGIDIVPEMMVTLQQKFGNDLRSFRHGDIISAPMPSADMWLSRHFFMHLPDEIVVELLIKFKHGSICYLLTTTFNFAQKNRKINMGGFRYINLRKPPFCLPRPLLEIDDFVVGRGYAPHILAVWSREQLDGWHPV